MDDIKYYCFVHFCGFKVVSRWGEKWILGVRNGLFRRREFEFDAETIAALAKRHLSWLDTYGEQPVRLESYGRYSAYNAMLFGLRFEHYLLIENLWQGFLSTKSVEPLLRIAAMLYKDRKGRSVEASKVDKVLVASVAIWISGFKAMCYVQWPNLFRKAVADDSDDPVDMQAIMNQQIRALTGGDITKERDVLAMDVWRALTELDAKAREADEQRKQINAMKK